MKMSTREIVKTVILAVLLVTLVCLCSLYMLSYRGISDAQFEKGQMDRLGGKSVKYQYMKYTDASYVFPEFMGMSDGKSPCGFLGEEASSAAFYADIYRFYEKLFGTEGKTEALSAEEGKRLFADAIRGEYLYVRYACDLPKSIVMGMTGGDGTVSGISGEFLCEILILPDRTVSVDDAAARGSVYGFYGLARDSAGNYYRYTTSYVPKGQGDIGYHKNYYTAYTAMGEAKRYVFAAEKDDAFFTKVGLSRLITDTTVIFDVPLSGGELALARSVSDEAGERAILKAFLMNPERISSYTDESGTRAYFDEGKSVRFLKDGEVRYAALGQSGISLDEIFGYHPDGSDYDAFDSVGAALLLADSLGIKSEGKRTVYLSRMAYDGETLTLSFGYRYGGLPLFIDGSEEVCRVELQDGIVRGVVFRLYSIEETGKTVSTSDFTFALRGYLSDVIGYHRLTPMLVFSEETARGGVSVVAVDASGGEDDK